MLGLNHNAMKGEESMKTQAVFHARQCMIAWTPPDWGGSRYGPTAGQVEVGPWPVDIDRDWTDRYGMTEGACMPCWLTCSREELLTRLMTLFNTLVIREELNPFVVHRAFLSIKEYRDILPHDTPRSAQGPLRKCR
jgi:hypothetical protein